MLNNNDLISKQSIRSFIRVIFLLTIPVMLLGCSSESPSQGFNQDVATFGGVQSNSDNGLSPIATGSEQQAVLSDDQPNADSYLYMTAGDELFRVSAATGEVKMMYELPNQIDFLGPVDIVGDQIIVTSDDNAINSFDLNTGRFNWESYIGPYDTLGTVSHVDCEGTTCYAIGSGYELRAFNVRDGSTKWSHKFVTRERDYGWSATTSLVVTEYNVFVVGDFGTTNNSTLTILDRFNGEVESTIYLNDYSYTVPNIIGDVIVVATDSSVRAYDLQTSQILWKTNFDGENAGLYRTSPIAVAGNVISFISLLEDTGDDYLDRRILVGLDIFTGGILWTVDAGDASGIRFNPASDGQVIYIVESIYQNYGYQSKTGYVFAVDAASGNVLWKNDRDQVDTEPLVAAGHLYFGDTFIASQYDTFGDYYHGFAAMDKRNGQVTMIAPGASTPYAETPAMLHNSKMYRPDHWAGYVER